MSYIGVTPSYGDMKSQVFSGNNSLTSFALTGGSVANDASLLVSISGVTQKPGTDYSVNSLVNLVFTTAPPTGSSNILVIYLGRQVDIGTPGTGAVTDSHITAMSASKLTGTIADARFPSTLPAVSGANLTGIVSIPSGSMIDFAGASEPSGWVFCDGSVFNSTSDTSFAALYAVIANVYGGSDGTNFQVPDFRGRVTIGKDNLGGSSANVITHANADTLGGKSGTETHALVTAELAAHTHNGAAHTHLVGMTNSAGTGTVTHRGSGGQQATMTSGNTYPGAGYSTGSGTAHRNDQPWCAVTKIIKK